MTRLHLFDLDGTLLHRSAAPVEISRQLGLDHEIAELERDFVTRRIDSRIYAQRVHRLCTGLTEVHVAAAFEGAPWLRRIQDTWAEIRDRGEYCAVISLAFVLRRAADGVGCACGVWFALSPRALRRAG
ncbi:hypothetical protein SMA5143A_2503 [Streptomyces sp. MA5143a]|nr:hypothetical protein SMA5143A_2503 [Streptomyces sp. MA5143a]